MGQVHLTDVCGQGDLGMASILPFPRCCLESSITLNCMIFAAFPHPLCSLTKHWKSRRGGLWASFVDHLDTRILSHESRAYQELFLNPIPKNQTRRSVLCASMGIKQGPGNQPSVMIILLNNEWRTERIRHGRAHFGVFASILRQRGTQKTILCTPRERQIKDS